MSEPQPRWTGTLAFVIVLAALCAAATLPAFVNHDAAWYLFVVQRWFSGATLYRDVVDTNPPLIIWLTAPAVAVAQALGAGAPAVFKGYVFLLAGVSLSGVALVVGRRWPTRRFVLLSLAAFLAFPFVKGDFGQREHFAVLLTLPYIIAAAAYPTGMGRADWAIGVAAGLGFAIKPHFLIAWMLVEAAVAATAGVRAWRRTAAIAAFAACVLYGIFVLVLTPDYVTIAGQVRRVYQGLNSDLAMLIRLREVQLWIICAGVFAAFRWPKEEPLPRVLFMSATGYLIAAVLQLKGWGYHLYPARVFLIMFLGAATLVALEQLPSALTLLRGGARGLAAVFSAALVIASGRYIAESARPATPDLVTPMMRAIEQRGGPVTVLSMRTIIYPAFPAVNYAKAAWGSRHNSLWFLPGFYADQDRLRGGPLEPHAIDTMPPLERLFFDHIVTDLCATPPQLLAFEEPAPAAPAGRRALDLRAYYRQDPRAARLFDAYVPDGAAGPFTFWRPARRPSCE